MDESDSRRAAEAFARLVEVMARLRGPDGCPWDREQDLRSLRRYTLEEAYEVVQAIDDGDRTALVGELGDLLLQIVFLAQIASEAGDFTVADVADSIVDKLVRRHPHVFGDVAVEDADEVVRNWEEIKHRERGTGSVLDDVPDALPELVRAQKLGSRAARTGLDWPDAVSVLDKAEEELGELRAAMESAGQQDRIEEELGDLLAALTSLARHLDLSAELALSRANRKFEHRFRRLEESLSSGRVGDRIQELEAEWERIKADGESPGPPRRRRRGTAPAEEPRPGTDSADRED